METRYRQGLYTRRLYLFEEIYFGGTKFVKTRSMEHLRKVAKRVWSKYGNNKPFPIIVAGRGVWHFNRFLSYCYFSKPKKIVLIRNQREIITLLHELTHALGCYDHGPKFTKLYFILLEEFGSVNREQLLLAAQMFKVSI